MSYAYNQQSQKQALIGNIMGLMKELQNLAPHPDCPGYKGPLFIQSNPNFKLSDERDGMLGSMIMEGMIGAAFSEAVSGMKGQLEGAKGSATSAKEAAEKGKDVGGALKKMFGDK